MKYLLNRHIKEIKFKEEITRCSPNDLVKNCVEKLKQTKNGCIVIEEKENVIGIFTERDYLLKLGNKDSLKHNEPIKNYMTPSPVTLPINASIALAMFEMRMGNFRNVVIVDEKEKLVNVLNLRDLMFYLLDQFSDKTVEEDDLFEDDV